MDDLGRESRAGGRAPTALSAALVAGCLSVVILSALSVAGAGPVPDVPVGVATCEDGRAPIQDLYAAYLGLAEKGWQVDVVARSQPEGVDKELPIIALRTSGEGPAVWIFAGIHGEEPAGPEAVAEAVDEIAALGEQMPVVLIPLCNPQGYARNWRYLNTPVYSEDVEGQSVGDSSHLLPDPLHPARARAALPSSPEAAALTMYVLATAERYPPRLSVDLHEDNLIPAGYVYSQGSLGTDDPLAVAAVEVLRERGVAIQMDGETRFGEPIVGGLIGPVEDSSIDELMSASRVIVGGTVVQGPGARTVLVFETPAAELTLEQRTAAHLALLRRLAALVAPSEEG